MFQPKAHTRRGGFNSADDKKVYISRKQVNKIVRKADRKKTRKGLFG